MPNNLAARSQKYRLSWPLNAEQLENIDEMFDDLYRQLKDTNVDGVGGAIGSFRRTVSATSVGWSTLILPNAAVKGDLPYASATNVISMLADVATAPLNTAYLALCPAELRKGIPIVAGAWH